MGNQTASALDSVRTSWWMSTADLVFRDGCNGEKTGGPTKTEFCLGLEYIGSPIGKKNHTLSSDLHISIAALFSYLLNILDFAVESVLNSCQRWAFELIFPFWILTLSGWGQKHIVKKQRMSFHKRKRNTLADVL